MINTRTGSLKLDNHNLELHPELTPQDFIRGDIPIKNSILSDEKGWKTYYFDGDIDGLNAEFIICFRHETLRYVGMQPNIGHDKRNWGDIPTAEQKKELFDWLNGVIGRAPYNYEWGEIDIDKDIKTGDLSVIVLYRIEIMERQMANKKP